MSKRTTVAKWLPQYERWQIKVRKDGERKTFTCPTPGREGQRECHKKADAWLDDGIVDASIKVNALFDQFIAQLKIDTGKSHWSSYESFGRLYIKPCKGTKKVSALIEHDLQQIITYMKEHATKKPLSAKYYNDMIGCLTSFIKYARKCGASSLHIEKLSVPHDAKESNKLPLVPSELSKLFGSSEMTYHKKIVEAWYVYAWRFAVVTGMRPGEICGLQKQDIDKTVCSVRRSINVHGETTSGKSKNARRSYEIPPIGLTILADQKKMLKRHGVISPYIFPDREGSPFDEKAYYSEWVRFRKHNGIAERTPYEMRHTFFSVTKKFPAEMIKLMGGHGKDFDTFGTYGHELPGESEKVALLVDAEFKGLIENPPDKRG